MFNKKIKVESIKAFIKKNLTWLIVSATVLVVFIAVIAFKLEKNSHSEKVYSTKVEKISVNADKDWKIEGTTNAPSGSKILVFAADSDDEVNTAESNDGGTYAKVHDGKFEATVDFIDLASGEKSETANAKVYAKVVAVNNYTQDWSKGTVSNSIVTAAEKTKDVVFKVTKAQAQYSIELSEEDDDDEDESSSSESDSSSEEVSSSSEEADSSSEEVSSSSEEADSSSEETSSSSSSLSLTDTSTYETGITYEQIARNPKENLGKGVTFTGKVLQTIEEDGTIEGLRMAVDGDYDQVIFVKVGKNAVEDDSRILEDDLITVRGIAMKTITYEATSGASITVPAVWAVKIDNQGQASSSYGY